LYAESFALTAFHVLPQDSQNPFFPSGEFPEGIALVILMIVPHQALQATGIAQDHEKLFPHRAGKHPSRAEHQMQKQRTDVRKQKNLSSEKEMP